MLGKVHKADQAADVPLTIRSSLAITAQAMTWLVDFADPVHGWREARAALRRSQVIEFAYAQRSHAPPPGGSTIDMADKNTLSGGSVSRSTLPDPPPARNPEFEALVHRELELIGEDPDREGLRRTPQRVATSLNWLTRGYGMELRDVVGSAVFKGEHSSMVMVRDIELYSLCEHHMLPFFGRAHIAYIPDGKIVGLSKLPRIVEMFARRLQVQERLTEQIAQAVQDVLEPKGVGVVIEARHLCMMMRGVQKQNSQTVTSAVRGIFRNDARTREEFLALAYGQHSPSR
jgi:GTP cyclohydrolase I